MLGVKGVYLVTASLLLVPLLLTPRLYKYSKKMTIKYSQFFIVCVFEKNQYLIELRLLKEKIKVNKY